MVPDGSQGSSGSGSKPWKWVLVAALACLGILGRVASKIEHPLSSVRLSARQALEETGSNFGALRAIFPHNSAHVQSPGSSPSLPPLEEMHITQAEQYEDWVAGRIAAPNLTVCVAGTAPSEGLFGIMATQETPSVLWWAARIWKATAILPFRYLFKGTNTKLSPWRRDPPKA